MARYTITKNFLKKKKVHALMMVDSTCDINWPVANRETVQL